MFKISLPYNSNAPINPASLKSRGKVQVQVFCSIGLLKTRSRGMKEIDKRIKRNHSETLCLSALQDERIIDPLMCSAPGFIKIWRRSAFAIKSPSHSLIKVATRKSSPRLFTASPHCRASFSLFKGGYSWRPLRWAAWPITAPASERCPFSSGRCGRGRLRRRSGWLRSAR